MCGVGVHKGAHLGIEVRVLRGEQREGRGRGNVELSKLLHRLLHAPCLPLLLRVSILHHQRRRRSLLTEEGEGGSATGMTRAHALPSKHAHRHDLTAMHLVNGHLRLLPVGELDEGTAFALALLVPQDSHFLH